MGGGASTKNQAPPEVEPPALKSHAIDELSHKTRVPYSMAERAAFRFQSADKGYAHNTYQIMLQRVAHLAMVVLRRKGTVSLQDLCGDSFGSGDATYVCIGRGIIVMRL